MRCLLLGQAVMLPVFSAFVLVSFLGLVYRGSDVPSDCPLLCVILLLEEWTYKMLTLHQARGPPLTHFVRNTPRFIGRTQLVTMDIDTGDSPPVSSRPYTLALKHHRWVQEEIETLERGGIITKSMSPWASPIVIVPKKSQPGEPPKKRLCIDFRKINDLQRKVKMTDHSTCMYFTSLVHVFCQQS